jgi:hypothetical protein
MRGMLYWFYQEEQMGQRNYVQVAMMKRYGKTQTVFQDRRTKRSGEKIDWIQESKENDSDDDFLEWDEI